MATIKIQNIPQLWTLTFQLIVDHYNNKHQGSPKKEFAFVNTTLENVWQSRFAVPLPSQSLPPPRTAAFPLGAFYYRAPRI